MVGSMRTFCFSRLTERAGSKNDPVCRVGQKNLGQYTKTVRKLEQKAEEIFHLEIHQWSPGRGFRGQPSEPPPPVLIDIDLHTRQLAMRLPQRTFSSFSMQ